MRVFLPQPALTYAVPCGKHAARAQASADAATPGPARLHRRALLAASLGGLLAPRALAASSPYDDVLPPVGVLNGRVPNAACTRALWSHANAHQTLAVMPVNVQLRQHILSQQRPVHGSLGCRCAPRYGYCGCCLHALNACAIHSASRSARAQERQSRCRRDRGGSARPLPTSRAGEF